MLNGLQKPALKKSFKIKFKCEILEKNIKNFEIENLGGEVYERINLGKNCEYLVHLENITCNHKNFIGYFLHGLKLNLYLITL